jgi:hypothetical protein
VRRRFEAEGWRQRATRQQPSVMLFRWKAQPQHSARVSDAMAATAEYWDQVAVESSALSDANLARRAMAWACCGRSGDGRPWFLIAPYSLSLSRPGLPKPVTQYLTTSKRTTAAEKLNSRRTRGIGTPAACLANGPAGETGAGR